MRILLTIVAVLFSLLGLMSGSWGLFMLPLVMLAVFLFLKLTDDTDDVFNNRK